MGIQQPNEAHRDARVRDAADPTAPTVRPTFPLRSINCTDAHQSEASASPRAPRGRGRRAPDPTVRTRQPRHNH